MFCAVWLLRSPRVLEARLVDHVVAENLRVAQLQGVLHAGNVVGLALQCEERDAAVGLPSGGRANSGR